MTQPTNNANRFDPTAPVGADDAGELREQSGVIPAAELRTDDQLTRLIGRATQPPADLKLDWGRLHAAMAKEPMLRPAAKPAARQPRVFRAILYVGSACAAAAAIMLTTVFVLHQGGPVKPGDKIVVIATPTPTPAPVAAAPQPDKQQIIWVGLPEQDANDLVNDKNEQTRNDLVVVFPRSDSKFVPKQPAGVKTGGPVMTDKAPRVGSPYSRQARDADGDTPYPGF